MTEETYITPHVVGRVQDKHLEMVEVTREGITALAVFRNEDDARGFMEDSGNVSEEGFKPVPMDHETIAAVLDMMDISHVALSEEWTGANGVDVFTGENFVKMLEDSLQEA